MKYLQQLIENCKIAMAITPCREFIMKDPDDLDGINSAIYVIEQVDGDEKETFVDYARFKQAGLRSCSRLNAPSKVLYVGSSNANIRRRISQHLGNGNPSTYALHLSHWFRGQTLITIKVYDQPREILQLLEDALSEELKPAFGKQGGNNR